MVCPSKASVLHKSVIYTLKTNNSFYIEPYLSFYKQNIFPHFSFNKKAWGFAAMFLCASLKTLIQSFWIMVLWHGCEQIKKNFL